MALTKFSLSTLLYGQFVLVFVVSDVSGGPPGAESTRLDTSTNSNNSKEVMKQLTMLDSHWSIFDLA